MGGYPDLYDHLFGVTPRMKSATLICSLLAAACMFGCSKQGTPYPTTQGSGDLAAFVLQCVTNRGGHVLTNPVSSLEAKWTMQKHPSMEIIEVPGDRFVEVQTFLRQAFGEPDAGRGSQPVIPMGPRLQGIYSPDQIGVGLLFTSDSNQTYVQIVGR
jgi:hypothetical protein